MFLNDDVETQRLTALIQGEAKAWSADDLDDILQLCQRHKPRGYDEHVHGLRQRYSGSQADLTRVALEKRFPKTHSTMPVVPLNWLRFFASQDAGVYRLPPERTLVDADDVRKAAFAALVAEVDLVGKMPENERRALTARTLFFLPRWDGKRLVLDVYWPDDVGVVCHPSDPNNFNACTLIVARIASRGGVGDDARWYNVWTRDYVDDDMGAPASWGPWRVTTVSSEGEFLLPPTDDRTLYLGPNGETLDLPWCVLQIGEAQGCVFVDEDRDVVRVNDELNLLRSSLLDLGYMQGHTPIVYAGNEKKASQFPWGPGEVWQVGQGESAQTLSLDPKLDAIRALQSAMLRETGVSRDNSPSAYTTETGPAETATAKKIEERSHDRRLDELAHVFTSFERDQLLPKLVMVHDAFSGRPAIGPATFSVVARKPTDIEEPESKQRRLQADYDAGLISKAKQAVLLGYYPDVEAAKLDGLSDEKKKVGGAPSALPAFARPFAPPAVDGVDVAPESKPAPIVEGGGGVSVAATALNGAQVQSLVDLVAAAASKQLPVESVRAIIAASFPAVPADVVNDVLAPLTKFTPAPEVP